LPFRTLDEGGGDEDKKHLGTIIVIRERGGRWSLKAAGSRLGGGVWLAGVFNSDGDHHGSYH